MFVLELALHEFEVADHSEATRLKVHLFTVNYNFRLLTDYKNGIRRFFSIRSDRSKSAEVRSIVPHVQYSQIVPQKRQIVPLVNS